MLKSKRHKDKEYSTWKNIEKNCNTNLFKKNEDKCTCSTCEICHVTNDNVQSPENIVRDGIGLSFFSEPTIKDSKPDEVLTKQFLAKYNILCNLVSVRGPVGVDTLYGCHLLEMIAIVILRDNFMK